MISGTKLCGLLCLAGGLCFISHSPVSAQTTMPTTAPSAVTFQAVGTAAPAFPYNMHGSRMYYQQFEHPEDPASIEQEVSCLLQIDSLAQPSMNGFGGYNAPGYFDGAGEAQFATALLSSSVAGDGASTWLNLTTAQRQSQIHVHATAVGSQILQLDVVLLKGEHKFADGDAQSLMKKLIGELSVAFSQSAAAHQKAADAQNAENAKTLAEAKKQLAELRSKLRADEAKTSTVPNVYGYGDTSNQLINARNNRQNAAAQVARTRASLDAIQPPETSSLISGWEDLVKQDEQHLHEVTAAPNSSTSAVEAAQTKLTQAKNHLESALLQEKNSNDGRTNYRTQEIANLKSNLAQQEATLKEADDTIAKLTDPDFQNTLDEQRELQTAEQTQANRIAQLQNSISQVPLSTTSTVTITVLDGKAN